MAVIQTAFPGDLILTTPVFESLKNAGHRVVAVVRKGAESILENNQNLDSLICFDKSGGLPAFVQTVERLKRERCEIALLGQKHLRSALLALYAGIERRVGFADAPAQFAYTDAMPFDYSAHAVKRYLSLCQGLSSTEILAPRIYVSTKERTIVGQILESEGLGKRQFIVLAPGSVWATKRWPYYQELAELIMRESNFDIAIVGGQPDREQANEIIAVEPKRIRSFAGKLSLIQSAAVMEMARLAITNDSAPAHMAAAVGTPVVAIFGPTVPEFGFAPFSDKSAVIENKGLYCRPCSSHGPNRCPEGHFFCMKGIRTETVWQEAKRLLGDAQARRVDAETSSA